MLRELHIYLKDSYLIKWDYDSYTLCWMFYGGDYRRGLETVFNGWHKVLVF